MVNLLFGIHCHQPVDNFYKVVDEAVEKAYRPFLEVAKRYPEFKFSAHYSGWLLEYISKHHKLTFKLLQELSERGQIEFFTAGFYEPVLSSIPSDDRKFQIEKLNRFIKENFGQEPKGLWLTERVWDPSIVKEIVEVGVEYVIVDDYHFISSGFKKDRLKGYYLTENDGYTLKLFPIDKTLRYMIPFRPVERIENYLEYVQSLGENPAAIIFDDGEKFGIWPNTYQWVYENNWLENFIQKVISSKTVKFSLYRKYVKENRPLGLAYLPTTSYQEMGEWSLPAEDFPSIEQLKEELSKESKDQIFEKFVKGGIWKNFFVKYPESNRIHKRMLDLSVNNRDLKKDSSFLDNLLKAQCNDVLWHGVFGGLYLPNLRDNAYRYIIKAQKEMERLKKTPKVECKDFDLDGNDEIKVSTKNLIVILSQKGGHLTELSLKDREFNYQNVLTRYREGYHYLMLNPKDSQENKEGISTIHESGVSISEDLKDKLITDWHTKESFVDHFTDFIDLESFRRENFHEMSDFTEGCFNIEYVGDKVSLKRVGFLKNIYNSVMIKDFEFADESIQCSIRFKTEYPDRLKYICEFNLHFAELPPFLREESDFGILDNFVIEDSFTGKKLKFEFDKPLRCLTYPINTISQSEKGVDLITQGVTVGFILDFELNFSLKIKISIT
ncbi:MAG: alpha-amylase/4-alpha-glucanotransferase domain-containing protein [Hydrogenothermaceae bacterium]